MTLLAPGEPASIQPPKPAALVPPAASYTLFAVGICAAWAGAIWTAGHLETDPVLHQVALFAHLAFLIVGLGAVLTLDWFAALWLFGRRSLPEVLHLAAGAHLMIWAGLSDPVSVTNLATATGRSEDDLRGALAAVPDTEYDEDGRIVGQGLTLRPTRHRFRIGDNDLYTWCALDTLIFPIFLGTTATIESTSPTSRLPVRLTAGPDAVTSVDPWPQPGPPRATPGGSGTAGSRWRPWSAHRGGRLPWALRYPTLETR